MQPRPAGGRRNRFRGSHGHKGLALKDAALSPPRRSHRRARINPVTRPLSPRTSTRPQRPQKTLPCWQGGGAGFCKRRRWRVVDRGGGSGGAGGGVQEKGWG